MKFAICIVLNLFIYLLIHLINYLFIFVSTSKWLIYKPSLFLQIKIQFAAPVSLLELKNFLSGKQNGKVPQDAVQALDIVMRQMPSLYYTPVGRSFFPDDGRGKPLGEGCEVKFGFYSSIRHSEWKAMLLNIDGKC